MTRFEQLLDKLMKENKIDKLELMRKIGQQPGEKNLLEERDSSQQSQDILLDEQIMNEQDSQLVDDEEHIPIEVQNQATNNNLYKFRNPDLDRPKTSNTSTRPNQGSVIGPEEKLT